MASFAKLGLNGKVIAVDSVDDKDCLNGDGVEDEEVGRQFLQRVHHWPLWKQTSYNTHAGVHSQGKTPFRGNHANVGMYWDDDNELFIDKQPYPSWTLNVAEARWISPAGEKPETTHEDHLAGSFYEWNETTKVWDKTNS
tara:strand:+ start:30 stop:449 length:420 start_codon:yes stop_codon:yes gene_type:complete